VLSLIAVLAAADPARRANRRAQAGQAEQATLPAETAVAESR
jgi:hypothetical protein